MTRDRVHAELGLCLAGLAVSGVAFGLLARAGWPGAVHECVASATCYCEAGRPGWIAQPANTWSSLAFIAAGLGIGWHAGRDRKMQRPPAAGSATRVRPGLLALPVCLLGPGAMFFHASLTDWGGVLDVASMYLFLDFWLLYNLKGLYGWSDRTFFAAYVTVTLALTSPRLVSPAYGVPVFVVVANVALATEWLAARPADPSRGPTPRRIERDRRWLWLALGALGAARAAETFLPCDPASLIQGHAVLHVFHALLGVFAYFYLRSEGR